MVIKYENEVCNFLGLPKLPAKEWDGVSAFNKGVAVIELVYGGNAYAVATFNPEADKSPRIIKVFEAEPFKGIEKILIVPDYMETNVEDADLDEQSKKAAEQLANEASSIENDGTGGVKLPENEYLFDNIHNDEEAVAFIEAYNKEHGIGGQIPKKHESILNRLLVIYSESENAQQVKTEKSADTSSETVEQQDGDGQDNEGNAATQE